MNNIGAEDRDEPIVWLLLLERGRQTGDFELAAKAKQELALLGIRVVYSRQPSSQKRKRRKSVKKAD